MAALFCAFCVVSMRTAHSGGRARCYFLMAAEFTALEAKGDGKKQGRCVQLCHCSCGQRAMDSSQRCRGCDYRAGIPESTAVCDLMERGRQIIINTPATGAPRCQESGPLMLPQVEEEAALSLAPLQWSQLGSEAFLFDKAHR